MLRDWKLIGREAVLNELEYRASLVVPCKRCGVKPFVDDNGDDRFWYVCSKHCGMDSEMKFIVEDAAKSWNERNQENECPPRQ